MVDQETRQRIVNGLKELEQEHGVRVLYACESGSRAWGFPSPDSDHDARFLFLHPAGKYTLIDQPFTRRARHGCRQENPYRYQGRTLLETNLIFPRKALPGSG